MFFLISHSCASLALYYLTCPRFAPAGLINFGEGLGIAGQVLVVSQVADVLTIIITTGYTTANPAPFKLGK